MKKIISISLLLMPVLAHCQTLSYNEYMKNVCEKNIGLMAERYNVDIATANLQASKVFNDPELAVSYSNNQDWNMQMGQSVEVELSYGLDLAGVRRARIRSAKDEKKMTQASVNAYLSNLKLEAASAWAEAWKLHQILEMLKESYNDIESIARADSIRLTVGDISLMDARQSSLEAKSMKAELLKANAEYINSLAALSMFMGGAEVQALSDENLPTREIPLSLAGLESRAQENRQDLKAAELSKSLSESNLKLVKASRSFEMGLSLGYAYNTEVRNEIAPAPRFSGLTLGVSIPLKFSSFNKGELKQAKFAVMQTESYYEEAKVRVNMEVQQAYNSFISAQEVYNQYSTSLLHSSREILEARRQGYFKGETSLLELLASRQTYRECYTAYIEACYDRFISEVQLTTAVGGLE